MWAKKNRRRRTKQKKNKQQRKLDVKIIFGILLTGICIVVMLLSFVKNRTENAEIIGLGKAQYPRISFQVDGRTMNYLCTYVDEMDIAAMRDTITPVPANGKLQINLQDTELELTEINYKVFSLDGTEQYIDESCKIAQKCELELKNAFTEERTELVLQIILKTEEQNLFYYTRIEKEEELGLTECLKFAEDFHNMTFDSANKETLQQYLEPNEKSNNTTYQTVDIHSNTEHICWGDLSPVISGNIEWSIKESNSSYTSLLAKYQVKCVNEEGKQETYNVREFFRVRLSDEEMYLLNYDRTMNQIFDEDADFLTEQSLVLGLTDAGLDYEINDSGNIIAFVQERELWIYNKKENKIIQVFSFIDSENEDIRNLNDEHALRIINMDKSGNTVFAVYGYMNRGIHEGKVGVAVYFYDIVENVVKEKVFIPSNKSFAIAEDELGKMLYYNQEQQMLYVLTGGVLYQVDMESQEQTTLTEGLADEQYVVCEDGHLLAYQMNGDLNSATEIRVMDLEAGTSYDVSVPENETIRPLGFVTGDFICGYVRSDDIGTIVTGEQILPMYKMQILEGENQVAKTYEQENVYISDVWVEENQITLNRMTKNEGIYTGIARDYITNTEEKRDTAAELDIFSTDRKETQIRFVFEEAIQKLNPEVIRPELKTTKHAVTIAFDSEVKTDQYYVYGLGKLQGIYNNASQAIQKAEEISGVVISSEQEYIWETGNRDLGYYIDNEPFAREEGQTSLNACLTYMEQYDAQRMDLAGCSLSQVMYVINRGMPMIAMLDTEHAVLIVGYNWCDMYYIDPDTGRECSMSQSQFAEVTEAAGNTFIGFK